MHLIIDFPWYAFLFPLLLGAGYSALLYFRNRRCAAFSRSTQWILAALRFVSVSLIAFLLLAPLVKRNINEHQKPIIVIAQDNSQSVMFCKDSAYYRQNYAQTMDKLIDRLSVDYDVRCYSYGSQVRDCKPGQHPNYSEQATDMASVLTDLAGRFENRNVGAVLLTGDGIYNQGINPVSAAEGLPYPVYTVALGDTTMRRDACIANVRFNRIAYLGNQFPMEITLRATRLQGQQKQLTVTHNGKILYQKRIAYSTNDFSTTEEVMVEADKPGLQTFQVRIEAVPGEVSTRNNVRNITVEVIDGRQKVAVIAAAPHPDVAALRRSLEQNQYYEVSSFLANDFKEDLSQYDLVILHQLPSKVGYFALVQAVVRAKVPAIFVIANQTDLARFNSLHLGLEIFSNINRQNESIPLFNKSFAHFTLSDDEQQKIEHFPPLSSPFGNYKPSGNTQSLFTAKVGTVNSGLPLVAFSQQGETRYAFVAGEGLWKWRMADFQANQSHDAFDALINKMVVYTSLQMNKDRFHVEAKPLYRAGDPVTVEAQLYNDNYELVNTPEAQITIVREDKVGTKSTYNFNRTANAYSLNLGILPAGRYRYQAAVNYGGKKLTSVGAFVVEDLNLEELNLVADHALLNTLATTTSGKMLMPDQIDQFPKLLKEREDIKTVIYTHTRYSELQNLPWILLLVILLLSVEWWIRKYNGEM